MLKNALLTGLCLLYAWTLPAVAEEPMAKLVEVQKIWGQAPHSAFADLIYHEGKWFCVFREGQAHVSPDGALRVITSTDGKEWTSAALVTAPDADLRDAKISVAPDGRLCLFGAGAWHQPQDGITHQSYLWYSKDGKDWGEAIPIGDPNYWLWRVVWHEGVGYGIGYSVTKERGTRLYKCEDGIHFEPIVKNLTGKAEGYANEAGMLFQPDETLIAVIRRDVGGQSDGLLGTSKPPYTEWSWKHLNERLGGPQLLRLPDGRIVLASRDYSAPVKTSLWWLDPDTAELTKILSLPSGGDTSYPGLVFHEGLLWVAYHSSHEGKTSIYLARVELP